MLRKVEELKYMTAVVKYFVESGQLKQDQEKFRELCVEPPQRRLHSKLLSGFVRDFKVNPARFNMHLTHSSHVQ